MLDTTAELKNRLSGLSDEILRDIHKIERQNEQHQERLKNNLTLELLKQETILKTLSQPQPQRPKINLQDLINEMEQEEEIKRLSNG